MGVHDAAERGFTAGVGAYERGRPSYPPEVVQHLERRYGLGSGVRVLDVGAGTGKLTALLEATGADVTALEPVAAMRHALARNCPKVQVVDGSAEQTQLADACVDLVVVAQAFHWFDARRATEELGRVLRPDGGLALIWNSRDAREPWVAEMSRIVRWNAGLIPTYDAGDEAWIERVTASGQFVSRGVTELSFSHELDAAGLRARVLSISYIAKMSLEEQAPIIAQIDALIADFPASFSLPYRTFIYDFQRR